VASIEQVLEAVADLCTASLYPNGPLSPGVVPANVLSYPGWPERQSLDQAMQAGNVHVSVFADAAERNTTAYGAQWREGAREAATYGVTVEGRAITVTGGPPAVYAPQNLAVIVDGVGYVAQAQPGDMAEHLAGRLLAELAPAYPAATLVGAVVTLPPGATITAVRLGVTASATRETKRQARDIRVSVWAPTPELRRAVSEVLDPALSALDLMELPDGSRARAIYRASPIIDEAERQLIYRRDFVYTLDFATLQTVTMTEIVLFRGNVRNDDDVLLNSTTA